MIQDFEQKMGLMKELANKHAMTLSGQLAENQIEVLTSLIELALVEYDAHIRVLEDKANIEWRENFLKMQKEITPEDIYFIDDDGVLDGKRVKANLFGTLPNS